MAFMTCPATSGNGVGIVRGIIQTARLPIRAARTRVQPGWGVVAIGTITPATVVIPTGTAIRRLTAQQILGSAARSHNSVAASRKSAALVSPSLTVWNSGDLRHSAEVPLRARWASGLPERCLYGSMHGFDRHRFHAA